MTTPLADPDFLQKLCPRADAPARVAGLPRPLVFTNGVFDLMHRGHATYLAQARTLGASLVVALNTGAELAFPPRLAEGLAGAPNDSLAEIEVSSAGLGLHWPKLDADLYVPALLQGVLGSKKWMARQLGAEGGKARTAAKVAASRANGRKGGRPRKLAGVAS